MNFSLINPISIQSAIQLFMNTDEKQNGLLLNICSSSLCKGKIGFFFILFLMQEHINDLFYKNKYEKYILT